MTINRDIKPIETSYKGYRFRSRLEARWAVFFDTLRVEFEYEPEGYVIGSKPYLPDFWLPALKTFAEVKNAGSDGFEGPHVDACRGLASATGHNVLLLNGLPAYRMFHLFTPTFALETSTFQAAFFIDYDPFLVVGDEYWFQGIELNERTGALEFPHDDRAATKSFGSRLVAAVAAARGARFEHGETGLPAQAGR